MNGSNINRDGEYFAEEYFHVYNRGVDKRDIFIDTADYLRFCEGLREFNTTEMVAIEKIRKSRQEFKQLRQSPTLPAGNVGLCLEGEKLVEILCWCLMPNHFHLLLRPLRENGITDFMRKVGTGYTKYFNKRYERSGHLFQGKYQHREVDTESSLSYVSAYIHLNPVKAEICRLAEQYPWSSYKDIANDYHGLVPVDKDSMGITANEYKIFVDGLAKGYEKMALFSDTLIDFD